jgi:hypothetical protein
MTDLPMTDLPERARKLVDMARSGMREADVDEPFIELPDMERRIIAELQAERERAIEECKNALVSSEFCRVECEPSYSIVKALDALKERKDADTE